MNRALPFLAALALVGCAVPDLFLPVSTCHLKSGVTVYGDGPLSCEYLEAMDTRAQGFLHKLVAPEVLSQTEDGVRVWMHTRHVGDFRVMAPGVESSACTYKLLGEYVVELDATGESWAHELLHVYQMKELHVGMFVSGRHEGWQDANWFGITNDARDAQFGTYAPPLSEETPTAI